MERLCDCKLTAVLWLIPFRHKNETFLFSIMRFLFFASLPADKQLGLDQSFVWFFVSRERARCTDSCTFQLLYYLLDSLAIKFKLCSIP